jgi:hypothetical protein
MDAPHPFAILSPFTLIITEKNLTYSLKKNLREKLRLPVYWTSFSLVDWAIMFFYCICLLCIFCMKEALFYIILISTCMLRCTNSLSTLHNERLLTGSCIHNFYEYKINYIHNIYLSQLTAWSKSIPSIIRTVRGKTVSKGSH